MSIQGEARAEAERRYAKSAYIPLTPDATRNALREAFEEGAVWQASRKPEAAPSEGRTERQVQYADGEWSRDVEVIEAAPSDTDDPFESLVNRASLALAEDGWYSHDEALTWEDLGRIARTVLRASQPVQVEVSDEAVQVFWYEHDCEWLSKYCDEHHRRSALVPRSALGGGE